MDHDEFVGRTEGYAYVTKLLPFRSLFVSEVAPELAPSPQDATKGVVSEH